jgi:serine/threonine protein phosphatase 1
MRDDIEWFRTLPTYHETDDVIFVHAGVRPNLTVQATTEWDRLWIREEFIHSPYDWGKVVVYGHTARPDFDIQPNKIGIDLKWHGAGCVGGIKLSGGKLIKTYRGNP